MFKFDFGKIVCSMALLVACSAGCQVLDHPEAATSSNLATTPPFAPVDQFKWIEIPTSFQLFAFASSDGRIVAIGQKGMVEIGEDGSLTNQTSFRITDAFRSVDGGLTRKADDAKVFDLDDLCFPLNAKVLSDSIAVYANCENTTQVWNISVGSEYSNLTLTDFIYPDNKFPRTTLWGPTRMTTTSDRSVFPSFLRPGPAFLGSKEKESRFEILWQGKWEDGGIAAVDFVGRNGWMLLSGGKLLRSMDNGGNWVDYSNIPDDAQFKVMNMKMMNESVGFIVGGEGLILRTEDSGKTWTKESSGVDKALQRITYGSSIAAFGPNEIIVIRNRDDPKWKKIEFKPRAVIFDMTFRGKKLYLLADGKLFYSDISDPG